MLIPIALLLGLFAVFAFGVWRTYRRMARSAGYEFTGGLLVHGTGPGRRRGSAVRVNPEDRAARETVTAVRDGDRDAFARPVELYQSRLYGVALMMTTLLTGERDRRLWRAVEALPSGERAAVILHYREGMTLREVAGALGVAIGTVKTQLFRARQRLRERKSLAADLGFDTQHKQEAP